MRYLLSATGKRTLNRLTAGQTTLYAFDFDGTLSRIVQDRYAAKLARSTRELLSALTAKAPTAIVSGRALDDLRPRADGAATYLIGNHGMEGLQSSGRVMHHAHDLCRLWIKELEPLRDAFLSTGIGIEDKSYSLTLHYRRSKSPERAREIAIQAAEQLTPPPRLVFGKAVVNVIPPGTPHKGTALAELMHRLRSSAALYVGDDDTDEDVFSLPDERIVSVRVGRKSASAARFYLHRQSEIAALLQYVLRSLA